MEKEELNVFNFQGNGVREINIDGEPWFVGKDVAEILGYSNSSKALKDHVDEEDKLNNDSLSSLGQRGGWLVNESGLYGLIISSKMPNAKRFKHWLTKQKSLTIGIWKLISNFVNILERVVDSTLFLCYTN